jgi:hypothetical protein
VHRVLANDNGKSRKVVLPDSLKQEIKGTKLQRELRRRGIGQHTIEKALHEHVRVNTYRKIVAAIEEYKRFPSLPACEPSFLNCS